MQWSPRPLGSTSQPLVRRARPGAARPRRRRLRGAATPCPGAGRPPGPVPASRAAGSGSSPTTRPGRPRPWPQHLRDLGIEADDDAVVTSAQAAARLVAEVVPPGSSVLVVGGEGLVEALAEHGLQRGVVRARTTRPRWSRGSTRRWGGSCWPRAPTRWPPAFPGSPATSTAPCPPIEAGRPATAPSSTPCARPAGASRGGGQAGAGPVRRGTATPRRHQPARGRRPIDTDIEGASRAGVPSLLVLTGVTSLADACAAGATTGRRSSRRTSRGCSSRTPRSSRCRPVHVAATGRRSCATGGLAWRARRAGREPRAAGRCAGGGGGVLGSAGRRPTSGRRRRATRSTSGAAEHRLRDMMG